MPRFNILGNLEVVHDGRSVTPSPPKVRNVLALLVVRANQVVHPDSLIEELWCQAPPKSAITTLQTYIYHLRKIFAAGRLTTPNGEELLVTRPPGYILRIPKHGLDADVFDRLVREGHDQIKRGRYAPAARLLREALGLWSGTALANVPLGNELGAYTAALEERRMHALELRIQADMELGRHRELIGELRMLTAAYPLNEWFSSQLITALAQTGRRSDALDAYRKIRTVLRSELGLEPSPDLEQAQQDVLRSAAYTPGAPAR
jgi:DNA-binding SARP family transcriptional activator